uniref:Centrosomal protein of 162 kDa n=1 Tax=Spongospora subterranea TaxID=70186 RepID=A0A0H5QVR3_9EUKA|eukprot:CRZ06078.1 hypothetical protein [Spongospora subterranea]
MTDPFDVDDIHFSSDEELQNETAVVSTGTSLLEEFKSRRTAAKIAVSPETKVELMSEFSDASAFHDTQNEVNFDYDDDFDMDSINNDLLEVDLSKPERPASSAVVHPVLQSIRSRSFLDTLAQLKSHTNSNTSLISQDNVLSSAPSRSYLDLDTSQIAPSSSPDNVDITSVSRGDQIILTPKLMDSNEIFSIIAQPALVEMSTDSPSSESVLHSYVEGNSPPTPLYSGSLSSAIHPPTLNKATDVPTAVIEPIKPSPSIRSSDLIAPTGEITISDSYLSFDSELPSPEPPTNPSHNCLQHPETNSAVVSATQSVFSSGQGFPFPLHNPSVLKDQQVNNTVQAVTSVCSATSVVVQPDAAQTRIQFESLSVALPTVLSPSSSSLNPASTASETLAMLPSFKSRVHGSDVVSSPAKLVDPKSVSKKKHKKSLALSGLKKKFRSQTSTPANVASAFPDSQHSPDAEMRRKQQDRVRELERDKFLLESKLSHLSTSVNGSFRDRFAMGSPLPLVNDKELADIRSEMQTMESIIASLNEENAKLCVALKHEQLSMKGTAQQMLTRNTALRAELDTALAEIQDLRSAHLINADDSAVEEIRRLKQSLVQLRNETDTKLRASQNQIETLRRTNEELEHRIQNMNYDPISPRRSHSRATERFDAIAKKKMIDDQQQEIAELRDRIAWFSENQQMIQELEAQLKERDETIQSLQQRVEILHQPKTKSLGSTSKVNLTTKRHIRELEQQVATLQKNNGLRRTVAELVKAAGPDELRQIAGLQSVVDSLRQELAVKDDEHLIAIRGLRQDYEKMRCQYDERIAQLLIDRKENARPHERIRELEAQIDTMRETYRKKTRSAPEKSDLPSDPVYNSDEVVHLRAQLDEASQNNRLLHEKIKNISMQSDQYLNRIQSLETQAQSYLLSAKPAAETKECSCAEFVDEAHALEQQTLKDEVNRLTELTVQMASHPQGPDTMASQYVIASPSLLSPSLTFLIILCDNAVKISKWLHRCSPSSTIVNKRN